MNCMTARTLTMLACAIEADRGVADNPSSRGDLDDTSALARRVHLPHEPHRLLQNVRSAPEVDLEHRARRLVRGALDLPEDGDSGVADDNVQPSERFLYLLECIEDVLVHCDVDLEDEEAIGVLGLEVVEDFELADRGDCDVALLEDVPRHVEAETGGGSGD